MYPTTLLSIFLIMISTIFVISSSSWIIMWMSLEMNMMAFIPIMFYYKNKLSSESMIKYFLIQTLGSLTFLFSMMFSSISLIKFCPHEKTLIMSIIFSMAMVLKLGSAPFHQWFPSIVEGLLWFPLIILLTWQKIAPLSILTNFDSNMWMIFTSAILSAMLGSLGGFNQTLLRKILAFSSISHLGWLLISSFNKMLMFIYLMIYILLNLTLAYSFLILNMFHISHLSFSKFFSLLMLMNLISLGGLPPLLGFFPKWLMISWLIKFSPLMTMTLILSALINLSFYLRILYKILMLKANINLFFSYSKATKIYIFNSFSMMMFIPSTYFSLT